MKKTKLPFLVGITGGIGSGKSTICKVFNVLGVPIYEADARAKWLMIHQKELVESIKKTFGEQSYQASGDLNRAYLAQQVFNSGDKVQLLNQLVHPRVGEDFRAWAQSQKAPYVLNEAALMFESGRFKDLDSVITVFSPEEIRLQRIQKRDPQRSESEIRSIFKKQMPEAEKIAKADHVLYNDGKELLIPRILKLHEGFLKASQV